MKYLTLALALTLTLALPSFAQFNADKLKDRMKDKVNEKVDKANDKVLDATDKKKVADKIEEKAEKKVDQTVDKTKDKVKDFSAEKLEKAKKDYDEASFNYAISFSDNAGLFETKEKGDRHKELMANTLKFSEGADLDPIDRAKSANSTGEMLFANGKFSGARLSFNRAIGLYERNSAGETKDFALSMSNLSLLDQTTGRYTLSLERADKAITLREKLLPNSDALAASLNNKAVLYKDMGNYNEAEKLIARAITMTAATKGKTSVPYAVALNNKAMLFQAMGRYEEAEKIMKEALAVAKDTLKETSSNYIKLTINLAILYRDMNKYEDAENIYVTAMRIKERKLGKNHPDYAHLERGLADLYVVTGKTEKVESLLKDAAGIYKRKFGEEHPAYAATISDLGNFYRSGRKTAEAEPHLTRAFELRKKLLGENHPDYVNSMEDMALLRWQQSNYTEATAHYNTVIAKTLGYIDNYFAPMSESEKTKFWDIVTPRFQRFNSYVTEAASKQPELLATMYNNQLRTKALLLNSSNKVKNAILSSGNKELVAKYTQWLDQKEELARLYTLSKVELKEENVNLDSLQQVNNALEKQLSSQSNAFSQGYAGETVTYANLAAALTADEAVVDIIQFHKFNGVFTDSVYYAALVVTKDQQLPTLVLLRNGKDLESTYIKDYRSRIKNQKADEDSYSRYWAAIDKAIGAKKTVYLSLDGVYNQVSINTLKNASGNYLIESKNFVFLTNSKDIVKMKKQKGASAMKKSAVLFGFPDYGKTGTISSLPGTKTEVNNINAILKSNKYSTQVHLATDASEENVKKAQAEILHIATHGFFLSNVQNVEADKILGLEASQVKNNPLNRSGLLFANCESVFDGNADRGSANNGILTAYEAMNLSLENTELVVMSACETGLGDIKAGEGVYGLQRAFQVAGAKSIIMSLWQVSDDATMELMTSFYKNYSLSGNKQDAFIKAQKQIRTKYAHPFYWGAFVMVGN